MDRSEASGELIPIDLKKKPMDNPEDNEVSLNHRQNRTLKMILQTATIKMKILKL
jgi:hypothetical protein